MARVVCFGEMLLRLSAPAGEVLLQSPLLEAVVGGAEANVAVSVARLGGQARMATVLPDNAIGRHARGELARHGVDVSAVVFAPGRMGLYFLTPGALVRASEVIYDRAGSAFAEQPRPGSWRRILKEADWLHLSGITPALGPRAAAVALSAADAAREAGVKVSFDGNFRPSLWVGREKEAPATLRTLVERADLLFGDDRDIALILGATFDAKSAEARFVAAADAAFEAFPQLGRIAATNRAQQDAARHRLGATSFVRDGRAVLSGPFQLEGVVDRIGAGDAFAAGYLHGLSEGLSDQETLDFALAAAALKHAIRGDFNLATAEQVRDLAAGAGFHVRR
jgi:2-dehydro-3-deoxygluconokinase